MAKIIEIKNVIKAFGSKRVIQDLSFDVEAGEIFAFLGPNGSGKTTTLRCLLNIYKPDQGELLINGKIFSTEMSEFIGYLPEERGLYLNSKVLEILIYFGELKGLSKNVAKDRAIKYLERVELLDKSNIDIKRLSSGQQQKIQLGITIINNPKLLILDEPTKGLDPINRALLLEILMELNKQGSTIIFSTHQMEEVEKIANRLVMIKDGKRVLYGTVNQVKKEFGKNLIFINYNSLQNKPFPLNDNLYTAKIENNYAELTPRFNITNLEILDFLVDRGIDIINFNVDLPSLDDIFLNVMHEAVI